MAAQEQQAVYAVDRKLEEDSTIAYALEILEGRLTRRREGNEQFSSPGYAADYAKLKLAALEQEVFLGLFLDSQHRLISAVELFRGTVNAASVYPREVVKEALRLNASAVIFAHGHPSGMPEPSTADRALTTRLKQALALVDVIVLDHFVVGEGKPVSFAERGLL